MDVLSLEGKKCNYYPHVRLHKSTAESELSISCKYNYILNAWNTNLNLLDTQRIKGDWTAFCGDINFRHYSGKAIWFRIIFFAPLSLKTITENTFQLGWKELLYHAFFCFIFLVPRGAKLSIPREIPADFKRNFLLPIRKLLVEWR